MDRLAGEFRGAVTARLVSCGVDVVFCQWGVDLELCHCLAQEGVAVVSYVPAKDIERLALCLACPITPRAQDLQPELCGRFASIELLEVPLGAEAVMLVAEERGACSGVATVLLREDGSTQDAARSQRALTKGIAVAATCLASPRVMAGGGATEVALYRHLCAEAGRRHGVEARVFRAYAESVLGVVATLAENAGLTPALAEAELVAIHQRGQGHHGITPEGTMEDMPSMGVAEPLAGHAGVLRHATELACALCKVVGGAVPCGQ